MTIVYSHWYIVMALLIAAIVALIVVFVKMDKKDRVIIKEFVDSMQQGNDQVQPEPVKEENSEQSKE